MEDPMGDYEIRILKADGSPSLVYACSHASAAGAIRSAENIPRGRGDKLEVWHGMTCIHRDEGMLIASTPQDVGRPRPLTDRAISIC